MGACTVQIFAKAPLPGTVKTRLTPALSDDEAAALQTALIEHTLNTCVESGVGRVELWCAPSTDHPVFADCARRFGIALRLQQGNDLGQRMRFALGTALEKGCPGILVGSDCPAMDASYLRQARRCLELHDAVLGPATDGGYVLIGLSRDIACFDAVRWSTAHAYSDTAELLRQQGVRWCALPTLWDVDTPEDLAGLAVFPEFARYAALRNTPK